MENLSDLSAFVAVAKAGGFRDAARVTGASASHLSEAVRRLEAKLGVRLLNRTTRSVAPTEAGTRVLERLIPAIAEMEAALDVVNAFRDRPTGTLRLNVPSSVAHGVLPPIIEPFLAWGGSGDVGQCRHLRAGRHPPFRGAASCRTR